MTEPVFFPAPVPLLLADVATLTRAVIADDAPVRHVAGVAPLDMAGPDDISFIDAKKYRSALEATRAGAVFCREADLPHVPAGAVALVVAAPYRCFAEIGARLFPHAVAAEPLTRAGIAAGAHVDPLARLEDGVTVEAGAVVGPDVEIGAGTVVGPNAVIGRSCRIGRNCRIGAGATVQHALIGNRVILHPGVRLGQDGFGYSMGPTHVKIPQLGRVIVQDDVEIGANTTVDRGSLRDTTIGEGTKIDNLVQIGHNVMIGRHCVIVGQVGVSGSAELGDYVVLGGKASVGEHIKLGMGAQIGGTSAVNNDVPAGERWIGSPARPVRDWMRSHRAVLALSKEKRPANRSGEDQE